MTSTMACWMATTAGLRGTRDSSTSGGPSPVPLSLLPVENKGGRIRRERDGEGFEKRRRQMSVNGEERGGGAG